MGDLVVSFVKNGWIWLRTESIGSFIVRGAGGVLLLNVAGQCIAFGLQLLLTRTLGAKQFGIYSYPLIWVSFLLLLATLRLDMTLLRYVAVYQSHQQWSELRGILQWSNRLTSWISLAISATAVGIIIVLRHRMEQELFYTFLLAWCILPIWALTKLRQAALRSLKRVMLAQFPEAILQPILLSAFIAIYLYLQPPNAINSVIVMILNLLAILIAFAAGTVWLHTAIPKPVSEVKSTIHTREWMAVTFPLFFIAGSNLIFQQTDKLMIGLYLGATPVGIYTVVSRITSIMAFGLNATNIVMAPMIAEMYAQQHMRTLQQVVTLTAWGIFVFTGSAAVVLVGWGRPLLGLFGAEFTIGYTSLIILACGQLVNALSGSVGFLLTMTGHQNDAAKISAVAALSNVVLNAAMIPYFGIEGAAISTTVTLSIFYLLMYLYVRRNLGIDPTIFAVVTKRRKMP